MEKKTKQGEIRKGKEGIGRKGRKGRKGGRKGHTEEHSASTNNPSCDLWNGRHSGAPFTLYLLPRLFPSPTDLFFSFFK